MGKVEQHTNPDIVIDTVSGNYHQTNQSQILGANPSLSGQSPQHLATSRINSLITNSKSRMAERGEDGYLTLGAFGIGRAIAKLPLPALCGVVALTGGGIYGFGKLADVDISVHSRTDVNLKIHEEVKKLEIGGADYCPVSADVDVDASAYWTEQQSVDASVHGIGGTVKGPKEIWGVISKIGLTGPACLNKQTGFDETIKEIPVLDASGKLTKETTTAVYVVPKENIPISFHISEKDPMADTFEADDNTFAKLFNIGGDQLALFPYTDFLHPTINMDIHTLLHQTTLTAAANRFAADCGPKIMKASETYLEELIEDEMFPALKDFGVLRENIHADMSNLDSAQYNEPYAASEDKLEANKKLHYSVDDASCDMSKDLQIEVIG